jgi:hypothetical protein
MILNLQRLADKEEDPEDTSYCVELTTNLQFDIAYLTSFDTDVHMTEGLATTRDNPSFNRDVNKGIKRRAR